MLLIKNGTILKNGELVQEDVLIDQDTISKIAPDLEAESAEEVIDASGLVVLPGLIDVHVHLREPGFERKETIKTGTKAAAHGGFTQIFAMPNLNPYPSRREDLENYLKKIEEDACITVHPFGTITMDEKGKEPADYAAMKELGLYWVSDDGVGVADENVMKACMEKAVQEGMAFSCHTEDMNYRRPGASVHDSKVTAAKGWLGIPSACESAQLIRDLDLVKETGVRYHADHISAKESVEALHQARAAGLDVSGEVTAHHLLLCDEDVQGPNWKMNPPLRSREDREALIQGLENGDLTLIASDHAPHTAEEKNRPMDKAPFGIVSLETSFPLLYTEFVSRRGRWSLPQLVYWMSTAPARRFGLEGAGELKEGGRADLFMMDPNRKSIIRPEEFESMGKNTPFGGWETDCTILRTIHQGKTVWSLPEFQG